MLIATCGTTYGDEFKRCASREAARVGNLVMLKRLIDTGGSLVGPANRQILPAAAAPSNALLDGSHPSFLEFNGEQSHGDRHLPGPTGRTRVHAPSLPVTAGWCNLKLALKRSCFQWNENTMNFFRGLLQISTRVTTSRARRRAELAHYQRAYATERRV
jgi:hypothetical protein